MKAIRPPDYDDQGINLADPHDRLGRKTEYITRLQLQALEMYVGKGIGRAIDLGCGYGRMTAGIAELGFRMVGMDPSVRVLKYARQANPALDWCAGKLPDLPFAEGSQDVVFLLNVIRSLHLMGIEEVCVGVAKVLAPGGRLVVIDNILAGDERYVEEAWFTDFFAGQGLTLRRRVAIRSGRNPWIYLIRFGLIPDSWLDRIARWEIGRMARRTAAPRWTYHNVLFVFERT